MTGFEGISMLNGIKSDYINSIVNSEKETKADGTSFDAIYKAALGMINSTNTYIEDAQQAEVDFALGNLTNAHELGAIQQKANVALQYTVAIRDKLLEAYKEIMNMQI